MLVSERVLYLSPCRTKIRSSNELKIFPIEKSHLKPVCKQPWTNFFDWKSKSIENAWRECKSTEKTNQQKTSAIDLCDNYIGEEKHKSINGRSLSSINRLIWWTKSKPAEFVKVSNKCWILSCSKEISCVILFKTFFHLKNITIKRGCSYYISSILMIK